MRWRSCSLVRSTGTGPAAPVSWQINFLSRWSYQPGRPSKTMLNVGTPGQTQNCTALSMVPHYCRIISAVSRSELSSLSVLISGIRTRITCHCSAVSSPGQPSTVQIFWLDCIQSFVNPEQSVSAFTNEIKRKQIEVERGLRLRFVGEIKLRKHIFHEFTS